MCDNNENNYNDNQLSSTCPKAGSADEDDNNENLYVITIKTIMMTTDHVQPVQRLAQVD